MSKIAILFAGTVFLATPPAIARERDKTDESAAVHNASDDSAKAAAGSTVSPLQRYCIVDTPTGTRIAHRVCKTRADWLDEGFDPLVRPQ